MDNRDTVYYILLCMSKLIGNETIDKLLDEILIDQLINEFILMNEYDYGHDQSIKIETINLLNKIIIAYDKTDKEFENTVSGYIPVLIKKTFISSKEIKYSYKILELINNSIENFHGEIWMPYWHQVTGVSWIIKLSKSVHVKHRILIMNILLNLSKSIETCQILNKVKFNILHINNFD